MIVGTKEDAPEVAATGASKVENVCGVLTGGRIAKPSRPRKSSFPDHGPDERAFLLPHDLPSLPGNGQRPSKIAYVGNLLSTKPYDGFRERVSLNRKLLETTISAEACHAAFKFLDSFIESDECWSVGNHSKGYRWGESIRAGGFGWRVYRCPSLIAKQKAREETIRMEYTSIEHGVEESLRATGIAIDDPESFVEFLPHRDGVKDERHRRMVVENGIWRWQSGDLGTVTRNGTGRMHHLGNRTTREVRACAEIDGSETTEVDLSCSQPYFLSAVLPGIPGLAECAGKGVFYDATYEQMGSNLTLRGCSARYQSFKRDCLMVLYRCAKNGFRWWEDPDNRIFPVVVAMEKAFPGINQAIDSYASKHGSTALPREMQRLEASIFIDAVLPILQGRDIPSWPLHDGFLCRVMDAETVREVLIAELVKATGIMPTVKIGKAG